MPATRTTPSSGQLPAPRQTKEEHQTDTMRNTQLYAYYKQATQDPPIDKAENPGTFDFKVCLDSLRPRLGAFD